MEWERTVAGWERVENGMGENSENNCGTGWGESREWNGREQERTTVALVGERVENGMGENRREQLWHWLGRE